MNTKETCQAAQALIEWLKSQQISPHDSVPVMATAMVVACISLRANDEDAKTDKPITLFDRVEAASRLVLQVAYDMIKTPDEFRT